MTANADIVHGYGERRHLPECPVPAMEAGHGPLHPEDAEANCICTELRACEQRVLDAAREAVMASGGHHERCICDECYGTAAAVAAIDALRGEE